MRVSYSAWSSLRSVDDMCDGPLLGWFGCHQFLQCRLKSLPDCIVLHEQGRGWVLAVYACGKPAHWIKFCNWRAGMCLSHPSWGGWGATFPCCEVQHRCNLRLDFPALSHQLRAGFSILWRLHLIDLTFHAPVTDAYEHLRWLFLQKLQQDIGRAEIVV